MRADQARTIPIDRYLSAQGIKPARARMGGRELWYSSPLREGDKNPSFKIDTLKNLWYDHGVGQGGNIIDLVTHLCACDVRDALHHLERTGLYSVAGNAGYKLTLVSAEAASSVYAGAAGEKENQNGSSALELISKAPLEHPALLKYLSGRGINLDIARQYVSQIDFKTPQSGGTYFGVGLPFLDNDEAGNGVTAFICDADCSGEISDMRQHYATHVDLNDWHTGRKL